MLLLFEHDLPGFPRFVSVSIESPDEGSECQCRECILDNDLESKASKPNTGYKSLCSSLETWGTITKQLTYSPSDVGEERNHKHKPPSQLPLETFSEN